MVRNVLLLGAAGRDFHNFNVFFRKNKNYNVVGFTATQIPEISDRKYPKELAGKRYPKGIPIYEEKDLEKLIKRFKVDDVVFSYSDVSHEYVMHLASRALAAGASFKLLGPNDTLLKSKKPIIAVCAVRTGCGKSPLSRKISSILKSKGIRFVLVRHPMPYGDLRKQEVQRFANLEDLDSHNCTIEEREDYEPHIKNGAIVYAGVDYEKILRRAEAEADVIIWDGGNNDLPFFKPDLHIVVADALRPNHEIMFHPGEANFRMADVIIVNKVQASKKGAKVVHCNAKRLNHKAKIIETKMKLSEESGAKLRNKKVLIVEDGPTVTHGGMHYGAGYKYAVEEEAIIMDPKPFAVGSIKAAFKKYEHLKEVLPAIGYFPAQLADLEKTINRSKADLVISGTPTDISRVLNVKIPILHVKYDVDGTDVDRLASRFLKKHSLK
jgi:predicted GTPase